MKQLFEHGKLKFPRADVLSSSAPLEWAGIATEVRAHPACSLPTFTSAETEITLSLQGTPGALVRRASGGVRQETVVGTGTLWITPAGSCEEATQITRPLSNVAHVYLSNRLLASLNDDADSAGGPGAIDYAADVQDDLIRQIGRSLVAEMRAPTPGGKVLAESLGLALAARIFQRHSTRATGGSQQPYTDGSHRVDDPRLQRVVDYMMAHLEEPIGLEELASVACLSPFHFARTFRMKAGLPPHRFLTRLRLAHARDLLVRSDRSISDIALACQFASQSNFTRAFKELTGKTPNQWRRLG